MITESTKKCVKTILNEYKNKRFSRDSTKKAIEALLVKEHYVQEVEKTLRKLKENLHTKKDEEIAEYLEILAYSNPFKSSLNEEKEGKGMRHPQLARSFGYMVSSGENATLLYNNLVKMYPLLNHKLLRMIAMLMGKTNKILQGKSPNEIAKGDELEEPTETTPKAKPAVNEPEQDAIKKKKTPETTDK